jgi:hypothetical protein
MIVLDAMEYSSDALARAAWVTNGLTDLFPGKTVSASTEWSGDYSADKAIDGSTLTWWASSGTTKNEWWKVDLGSGNSKTITTIKITFLHDVAGGGIRNFTISGSNNDIDYTSISSQEAANDADKTVQTYTFANATAYRYYRIDSTSNYRADNVIAFYEIQGYDASVGSLIDYSESTIKQQGSYSLKVIAAATDSLNRTVTKTCSPTFNLSGQTDFKFWAGATRTGSNYKIGIHDSGGTTTEVTPNIAVSCDSADDMQEVTLDLSAVADANKDAIDSIILTTTNADAENTIYLDYLRADNVTWPDAKYVFYGVDRGDGTTGTLHASTISAAAGSGSNLSAGILKNGEVVDDVTGTYSPGGTYAEGQAAQLATDQSAVNAAKASIKDDTTILTIPGTYDFTAAIAAGYASGEAAQLATDQAAVEAAKASIKDDTTILTITGTYDFTSAIAAGYASGEAAQLATDQSAVNAAKASIKDDTTILTIDGTYDFTSAIAAGYASGEAAQLATDQAAVLAKVAYIIDSQIILSQAGTYHEATAAEVESGVHFGPSSSYTGTYAGGTDFPAPAYVIEGHTTNGAAGTYHPAQISEVKSGVLFGANSGLTGTYSPGGTYVEGLAAQLATDQAAVEAAKASIKDDTTILTIAGTYNFTAAIAAAAAAQLVTDKAAVLASAAYILDTATILSQVGTYHEAGVAEVASGIAFGPSSSYAGTYGSDSPGDSTIFGDALSNIINSPLGEDAVYTPVSGAAKSIRVFIERNTSLQPTGFEGQVFERGTIIEALLADLGGEPDPGATFVVSGETYTVRTIEDNDDYVVRMVCS